MKGKFLCVLTVGVLTACGGGAKDEPTHENVAKTIEAAFADSFPPTLGQRIEVQKWDKLTYTCEPIEGEVKRLRCETGGKITIAGYLNGVQTKEGPQEVDPGLIITFEKRGEGDWVGSDAKMKDQS